MLCPSEKELTYLWYRKDMVKLIAGLIKKYSKPNSVVLDPFAGTGSIPVIAAKMGRRAIAVEISPCLAEKIKQISEKHGVNVKVICKDFFKTNFPPESIDLILTSPPTIFGEEEYSNEEGAWEHNSRGRIDSLNHFLEIADKILKPDGKLILIIQKYDAWLYREKLKHFPKEAHFVIFSKNILDLQTYKEIFGN